MASYVDLGLVRNLHLSNLSACEECYFLYSTSNGHLYAAFAKEELKGLNDQGSYPIQKIDEIKRQFLNVDQVESVSEFSLASRELSQISSVSFLDMGENISLEASSIFSLSSRKLSKALPSESEIRKTLKNTANITRSLDGTDGVYFLDSACESDHSLVLKCYSEPERAMEEVVADRFFQYFGFITPRYHLISSDNPIWELAKSKVKPLIEKLAPKKANNLKTALDERHDMTIMEMLPGKPFKEVTDIERVNSSEVLKALGAMIFLDAFIGNVDRLRSNDSNAGNFFLLTKKEYENDPKPVALLDHGHSLSQSVFRKRIEQDITKLLGTESESELGGDIIGNFFTIMWKTQFPPEKTHFLQKGVKETADSLISQFGDSTKEEPQENLSLIFSGLDGPQQKQCRDLFIDLVGHVKSQLRE